MKPDASQFEDFNPTTPEMMEAVRAQEHEYAELVKEQDHIKHGGVKRPIDPDYMPKAKAPF